MQNFDHECNISVTIMTSVTIMSSVTIIAAAREFMVGVTIMACEILANVTNHLIATAPS